MSPLERGFRAREVRLDEVGPGAHVPLAFTDPSEEHMAVRRAAGLFDFSFMGLYEFDGRGALESLQRLQTRNLARLGPGELRYTLLLREDGSVVNDATVWRLRDERFWLFTGRRSDFGWLRERSNAIDRSGETAALAIQGPASASILARLAGESTARALGYFRFTEAEIAGVLSLVGRLGYSGELGYELIAPAADGPALWQALLEAGRTEGVRECGFAAADSLRIESGYVLFGREIADGVDPFELGLARLVEFGARDFVGARMLAPRRLDEPERILCGLEIIERPTPARPRLDLPRARATSERSSPLYGRRLALGFTAPDAARPGTLVCLGDGRLARAARLPFYDPARRRSRATPL